MNEFLLIAGMAVATMASRIPLLVWLSKRNLPVAWFRALRYVPPAVLAAIILPAVLVVDGKLTFAVSNAPLAAGIVAALVGWRTRSLLLTILGGMAMLFIWRAVFNI